MKQVWDNTAPFVLLLTMILAMLFSDSMFGPQWGQAISSLVIGGACLLYLTFKGTPWFGVKYLREGIFTVVGLANITMGIIHIYMM